ncbi:hypothetical protein TCAL_08176 [Tigriopus californicus]|uniref:BSD domain-containing protein n=1 Tax=Tigriopus californicus TaxID=6832 RepID=A0A553P678_TIGCA|nr:synapse-associated protein 1-like [Tigriopus californicus]TRY73181.1 hypothetical protein TCAL_08176 [Tigriopus californicus]|eukprot:TCALIF_08176-PA protein Name:"Similar to Sap47 Synapse-associated protein of 47 kDa (Drosophila melanogaster)" AED:0.08 eAED:0.08 QI:0/-1/0/1/-1/1/1/0/436
MTEDTGSVKWLYPEELQGTTNNTMSSSNNANENPTPEESAPISNKEPEAEAPKSTESSVEEVSKPPGVEDITQKMTASANYLGSMFSSAWKSSSSAYNLMGSTAKTQEETETETCTDKETEVPTNPGTSFLSSAWSTWGGLTGQPKKNSSDPSTEKVDEKAEHPENQEGKAVSGLVGFESAFHVVGQVATNATNMIKDKVSTVSTTNMLSEFNKEQESFIKSKTNGNEALGLAPWVGYNNEEELKGKILALSEDRRTFVRAPPSGMSFEFDYDSVAATAMALLQEDANLNKMRYELVPKKVKEEEFWRNYFYRLSLIKQSFELKDLERSEMDSSSKQDSMAKSREDRTEIQEDLDITGQETVDDEFVSESYQASTSDIAEAEESIKNLGVATKGNEEWEAELEGELNEFEVVGGKDDNAEWENEIQEMLDEDPDLK